MRDRRGSVELLHSFVMTDKSKHAYDADDESDISEDPILSALNGDLESVLRKTDNHLFIFLGAALAAAYLPKHLHASLFIVHLFYAAAVAFVVVGIGFTISSVIKKKQKVAARYGLVCKRCGHRPKVGKIMLAAQVGQCAACGNALNVHKP